MARCECGICNHTSDKDCFEKECKCCINFHLRSGSKRVRLEYHKA